MDFTQNQRLMQITENTLIIGVDIAKRKHVARAIDDRGRDLVKRLVFENTLPGFKDLLTWVETLRHVERRSDVIIGMEPTGHYWLNLAYYLKDLGFKVVVVNPLKVKRSKEMDDDSPTKNDTKDAKVIAQLIKDGRFNEPTLPEELFAELREGMKLHDMIQEDLSSIKAQVHNLLDRYFPEFLTVFKDWTGRSALHLLTEGYFPVDIINTSEDVLLEEVNKVTKRSIGMKRIRALKTAAENSVGIRVGLKMARQEMAYLMDQYHGLAERLASLENELVTLVMEVPGAEEMMNIKGIGAMTVVAFFSEVGDITQYRDPRQIIKLAGLNLKMNQSGLHKGRTSITKRGRKRLRNILYQVAIPLAKHNAAFSQLHDYYRTRTNNPLTGKQSFIALARKLIKIFYVIGTRKCAFDPQRMMQDIPSLQGIQEAA